MVVLGVRREGKECPSLRLLLPLQAPLQKLFALGVELAVKAAHEVEGLLGKNFFKAFRHFSGNFHGRTHQASIESGRSTVSTGAPGLPSGDGALGPAA